MQLHVDIIKCIRIGSNVLFFVRMNPLIHIWLLGEHLVSMSSAAHGIGAFVKFLKVCCEV